MTYEEMGAALKSEREKRNLNIDDVANELKISPRHLRALENGDMDALPHPAYARGFLRSYATWLGVDKDEMPGSVAATPIQEKGMEHEELHVEKEANPRKSRKGVIFFIVLCALAAGFYYAWNSGVFSWPQKTGRYNGEEHAQLQSADNYIATREKAEKEVQTSTSEPEPEREEPAENELVGLPPIESAPEAESVAETQPEQNTAWQPETQGLHKLIITAIEECWVHSNADKTDTRQFSLRKGDTFALTFANSLELKLGNAGGVRLRYDGEDLPAPGTSGQVRTITFPPKNN